MKLYAMMEKLANLRPVLVNLSSLLLLHDNAQPHAAQQTVSKLQKLGLVWSWVGGGLGLCLPPLPSDLAAIDFYFFQSLDDLLVGNMFNTREAVLNAFEKFFHIWIKTLN